MGSIGSAIDPPPTFTRAQVEIKENVICPRTGWISMDWRELYNCRELLLILIWRDIKVRYKQTSLGVTWALIQPLMTMAIFSFTFGRVAGLGNRTGDIPYPVFVFAGLVPWLFFLNGVTWSANSLIQQHHILTKIYFPRLFVPTAGIGAFLVDMLISTVMFGLILSYYRIMPSWHVVFLPLVLLAAVTATLGMGYALSALTVVYRDLRYAVPFLMQILMFVSPVIYPVTIIPPQYRWILSLNPACAVIEAFRWSVLGTALNPFTLVLGLAVNAAIFVFGLFYFRKTERLFADLA